MATATLHQLDLAESWNCKTTANFLVAHDVAIACKMVCAMMIELLFMFYSGHGVQNLRLKKNVDEKLRAFIASEVAHVMYKMEVYVVMKKDKRILAI